MARFYFAMAGIPLGNPLEMERHFRYTGYDKNLWRDYVTSIQTTEELLQDDADPGAAHRRAEPDQLFAGAGGYHDAGGRGAK